MRIQEAISSFFEHGGNVEEPPSAAPSLPSVPVMSDSDMESPPESPSKTRKEKTKKPNSNFATLDSLQQEESSSDEEEGIYFYLFLLSLSLLCFLSVFELQLACFNLGSV